MNFEKKYTKITILENRNNFDHGSIWQHEALKQYHESFYTIIYD